jgi:hypothetical protein
LAVERIAEIHSRHDAEKPMNFSTSSKKGHATESKALAMSIFRRTHAFCLA